MLDQSERIGDVLDGRVRHVDELRHPDERAERGLRDERRERLGDSHRADGRQDLPLPVQRHQLGRDDPRLRRELPDRPGAHRDHRRRELDHRQRRQAEREDQPQRALDDLLLRVRHHHLVRLQGHDGEPRKRNERRQRLRHGDGPEGRHDVSLPGGRDERRRHHARLRSLVRHCRGACGHPRLGRAARRHVRKRRRRRQPERAFDQVVRRIRHDDQVRDPHRDDDDSRRDQRSAGHRDAHQPEGRHALPLPHRRDELRRHDPTARIRT